MSANYKRMLELLKKWPLDSIKGDRDYGLHLRSLAKVSFPNGNVFPGSEKDQEAMIDSLFAIADNKYGKMYGAHKLVGSAGLSLEQLRQVLADDFVKKYLQ